MKKTLTPSLLEKLDKSLLWHPFTQHSVWEKEPTLIIRSGKGVYLTDTRGRRYLDGVSSLWVNLLGHRHPALDRALKRQASKIAHSTFLGLSHEPGILLGKELIARAPRGLKRVFYSDNGATAVEVALKMAFQYWVEKEGPASPRKQFLAVKGSYHGDTVGAVSVGSIGAFHSKFRPLLFRSQFAMAPACVRCPFNKTGARHRYRSTPTTPLLPRPGQYRAETGCRWECLGDVEKKLMKHKKKLAAAILEPVVQGATGMTVMPEGYAAGFQRLCRQADVLLIMDEVATGFGRTGALFASEGERIHPDFLCLAKAISGGYLPMAATLTTETIFQQFRAPLKEGRTFFHGHSYTGNPLAAAVGLEMLNVLDRENMLAQIRKKARFLARILKPLEALPHVGSIRQAGLMVGIELVESKEGYVPFPPLRRMGARLCQRLLKKGIWIRPLGDTLVVMPPAVVSNENIEKIVREIGDEISRLEECPA